MRKYKQIVITKTPGCVGWCIETTKNTKKHPYKQIQNTNMYQKCTIQGTKECQLVTLKALPFNITRSLALQNSTKRRPRRFDTLSWEHRLCDIFNESNCSYTLLSNIESTI